MAFKMTYNKTNFPFKKNTNADEVLVEGQKDATETIFGDGDKAKINAAKEFANSSAENV
tara:strand:- start:166 stop:342 length:177 start_codon:yes stop_codon:yes gene_type:complete